jgi:hypothetical protein
MKKILNIESFSKFNDGRLFIRGTNSEFDKYSISEIQSFFVGEKLLTNKERYLQKVKIISCSVIEVWVGDNLYDVELSSLSLDDVPVNVSLYAE